MKGLSGKEVTALTEPPIQEPAPGWDQSLAAGALGPCLFHLLTAADEREAVPARTWLATATRSPISFHDDGGLFCGVTALAYVLHTAKVQVPVHVDTAVEEMALRKVRTAHARIDRGELPKMAEFDLIRGLSGIGVHLLSHHPTGVATFEVLGYLVRLTEPLHHEGEELPGWWTLDSPSGRPSPSFPGGHGNLGIAHGISGPLALLATALRRGVNVPGMREAVERICAWTDRWHTSDAFIWPRWITRDQYRTGAEVETNPMPLAWCYGTVGQARAQHIAAIAMHDQARRRAAQSVLAACAIAGSGPGDLDGSVCHGRAGLLQTLRRAAADDPSGALVASVKPLEREAQRACVGTGLLEGVSGKALTLSPRAHHTAWDACPLIT